MIMTAYDREYLRTLIAERDVLLAALKAAREFGLDDFRSGEQAVYELIDAAIAKAEGREP
jgi:hypothetical protein